MRTILYHADCFDGFTAAWACWDKWRYDDTFYFAADYNGEPPPWHRVDGHNVYVLDFCYSRATTEEIYERAASLIVLDHHASAYKRCGDLPYCTFDMERSGAGLTWDVVREGRPRPWLVDYVEDRDLWRWALPDSRAVNYGIAQHQMGFPTWSRLAWDSYSENQTREQGFAIYRFVNQQLERLHDRVRVMSYEGYDNVPVVNSAILESEVGNAMLTWYPDAPFAIIYSKLPDGMYRYSFRSRPGEIDVSEVAALHRGGGHPTAAGCRRAEEP